MQEDENGKPESRFPGYTVDGILGQGGLGEILRVTDQAFQRELALKIIRDDSEASELDVERFLGEAKLTGRLQHPVIPPVYALDRGKDGNWFYTMKSIRGHTLASVLKQIRDKPDEASHWSLRRLLTLFVQVCQAIAYAHTQGVIHRDIKPANIMLGDYGEVYLLDWGLAKALGFNLYGASSATTEAQEDQFDWDDDAPTMVKSSAQSTIKHSVNEESSGADATINYATALNLSADASRESTSGNMLSAALTMSGDILGTPQYMAPEQATGEIQEQDHRTDIYALGAILWEILTETKMRVGDSVIDVIYQASMGSRPDRDEIIRRHRIPPELLGIAWKATEPKPQKRYQSAVELENEIQEWLDGRRKWELICEIDFSTEPDAAISGRHTLASGSKLISHAGSWVIQDGCLTLAEPNDSILHIDHDIDGDVRIEMTGRIQSDTDGELSVLLCAPQYPQNYSKDDGYCLQFGADFMSLSKLARNGQDVAFSAGTPSHDTTYKISAECIEGLLTLRANDSDVLKLRDFFPLSGNRVGVYGYGAGVQIDSIQVWSAGVPRTLSCLAVPDAFAAIGEYARALNEYRRILKSYRGNTEGDVAMFKAGLCLLEQYAQTDKGTPDILKEAEEYFDELLKTPSAALGAIGKSRLAILHGISAREHSELLKQLLLQHTGMTPEYDEDLVLHAQIQIEEFEKVCSLSETLPAWSAIADCDTIPVYYQLHAAFQTGTRLLEANRFEDARCYLNTILTNTTVAFRHRNVVALIAESYLKEQEYAKAREVFRKAIERYGNHPKVYNDATLGLVETDIADDKMSCAEERLLKAIQLNQTAQIELFPAVKAILERYNEQEQFEQAEQFIQTILAANRIDASVKGRSHHAWGDSLFSQGKYLAAEEVYLDTLKQSSQDATTCIFSLHDLTLLYLICGRYDLATDNCERMLREYPDNQQHCLDAYKMMTKSHMRDGDFKAAFNSLSRWEAATPDNDSALIQIEYQRLKVYRYAGQTDRALKHAEMILQRFPRMDSQCYETHRQIIKIYKETGRLDEALSYSRQLLTTPQKTPHREAEIYLKIAETHAEQGDFDTAYNDLETIVQGDARSTIMHARLWMGHVRRIAGRPEDAARIYHSIIEDQADNPYADEATIWLGLLTLSDSNSTVTSEETVPYAASCFQRTQRPYLRSFDVHSHVKRWLGISMLNSLPGADTMLQDDWDIPITFDEAMRRLPLNMRAEFRKMVDYRASIS